MILHKLAVFSAFFILGFTVSDSFVHAESPLVSITENGWFVVANSYPSNSTFLGLTAGHWGDSYNVTIGSNVNETMIEFQVFESYGFPNAILTQDLNATIFGSGTVTVYLDLGSSSLGSPVYTDVIWSVR